MPPAIFAPAELPMVRQSSRIAECGKCGLYKGCLSPKMPVAGAGKRGIMIIGEAPGETEDKENKPFVGMAGERLRRELKRLGVDLFQDCWVTNSLICRPPHNRIDKEIKIDYCRPNVLSAFRRYKPGVIILLGAKAVRSVIGHCLGENPDGINRWAGFRIPSTEFNAWICPTFHPSFVEREEQVGNNLPGDLFSKHLERALAKKRRPFEGEPPDYPSMVETIIDPRNAGWAVEQLCAESKTVAFDYETTCLKPDGPRARIVSCSISNGERTIAYPWVGEAAEVTKFWLKSPDVAKIASNIKFEDRWTRAKLGFGVRNWKWDTMLAAHSMDNRGGVTSIKFQAFIRFGAAGYERGVEHYLKGDGGGNAPNRIRELDMSALLTYNGLDSLFEYKVAMQQMKEMGVTP